MHDRENSGRLCHAATGYAQHGGTQCSAAAHPASAARKEKTDAHPFTWELRQSGGSTSRKGGMSIRLQQASLVRTYKVS